jgi:exonuclease III
MINFCTYNSFGSGDGRLEYISDLLKYHDIILVQETWLLKDNLKFFDRIPGTDSHGISSVDDAKLLQGRPHGGCSIIWKKSLIFEVSPVLLNLRSKRICAVNAKLPSGETLLIINVYMPCDFVAGNLPEFREALDDISTLVNLQGGDYVLLGGDFNTDFRRATQNSLALNDFIESESFIKGINFQNSNVCFTYESRINGEKSILDHFLLCENLFLRVGKYVSVHDGENVSDHCPVSLSLKLDTPRVEQVNTDMHERKLNWNRATENNISAFQNNLDEYLATIDIPDDLLYCHNLHCTEHNASIQYLYDEIVNACMQASLNNIPFSAPQTEKIIPGWNETVQEHKRRAIFWHNLWKSNDSPRDGVIADIRRRTRARYHLAIKTARKNKEKHVANSLAGSLLNKENTSFWKEIKKSNHSTNKLPTSMDGHVGNEPIGIHWYTFIPEI